MIRGIDQSPARDCQNEEKSARSISSASKEEKIFHEKEFYGSLIVE